jgi:hypothetical protein
MAEDDRPAPGAPPTAESEQGPPLLCRLSLHQWPETFLRGASDSVRCLRCGAPRSGWRRWLP